jgi:hypothetical protein
MTATRFYRCGRTISARLGHTPTLGRVRIGLNMIHDPMGQRCRSTVGRKRSLHQNNDCARLQYDIDLRFDAYESRLQEFSRKYLHA